MLKGFNVSKKYEHVYVKMRLTDNMDYFDKYKGNLEANSQILIAYHWRKKLVDLRNKRKKSEVVKDDSPPKGVQSKVKPYMDGKVGIGSFRRN